MAASPGLLPQQPALSDSRAALDAALAETRAFAREVAQSGHVDMTPWADQFTEAIETNDDRIAYQPDLVDRSFPDEARRLIAKASRSWVFGGMGSWNDYSFEEEAQRERYSDASRRLFGAVIQACLAAVNCPLPD
jgi:hypothetical protein